MAAAQGYEVRGPVSHWHQIGYEAAEAVEETMARTTKVKAARMAIIVGKGKGGLEVLVRLLRQCRRERERERERQERGDS